MIQSRRFIKLNILKNVASQATMHSADDSGMISEDKLQQILEESDLRQYPDQEVTYNKVLKSLQESEFATVEQVGLIRIDAFLEKMRTLLMDAE